MDEKEYLKKEVSEHRRKLNLAKIFKSCTVFMTLAGIAAILLEGISLVVPFYYVHIFSLGAVLAGILSGIVYAFVKRSDMRHAAHCLDKFELKERILTAYENLDSENEFVRLQRSDAVRRLKEKRQKGLIRVSILPDKRRLFALVLSLGVAFGLSFVPSASRNLAKELHEIKEQAKEKEEELEKLVREMEQIDAGAMTEEQKAALKEMLDSLNMSMEELGKADSAEALAAAAQKLEYKYQQTAESLANLASTLKDPGIASAAQMAQANADSANPNGQETASGGSEGDGSDSGNGENSSGSGGNGENGDGSGDGDGNGNGDGNGSGDGNGNGNGNGSGNGNGNGNGSGNGNGNGSGSGSGRGTGSGNSRHDYVSVPNGVGDDPSVSGNKTGDDDSDYYRAQNGLAWNGDHVSLDSVISSYTENAYTGIDSGKYPNGMQDIIKDYFQNLND